MYINDDRLLLDLGEIIDIFCVSYVSQLAVWDEVFWRCTCLSPLAFSFNADKLCYLQDGKEGIERKLQFSSSIKAFNSAGLLYVMWHPLVGPQNSGAPNVLVLNLKKSKQ